jgi:hypothetical protein
MAKLQLALAADGYTNADVIKSVHSLYYCFLWIIIGVFVCVVLLCRQASNSAVKRKQKREKRIELRKV